MAQFYDQDNTRASYKTNNNESSGYDNFSHTDSYNRFDRRQFDVENLVKRSTMSPEQKERVHVIKAQQRRK